jgi:uncharacterized protein YktB (UPF0637 family)
MDLWEDIKDDPRYYILLSFFVIGIIALIVWAIFALIKMKMNKMKMNKMKMNKKKIKMKNLNLID